MLIVRRGSVAQAASGIALALLMLPWNGASAESLKSEVEGLLGDHPQIRAAQSAVDAGTEGERRERAGYLPTVTGTAGAGYEHTDSLATRAAGQDNVQFFATNATLEVRQNVFNGFGTRSGVRSAGALTRAAEETLTAVTQNVVLEAVTTYMNVLRNRELVRLNRGNERAIQEQLQLEDERVQRGSGIAVDVLEAKSRLQIAREQSVAFQGALKDTVANYIQVFGHAPVLDEMRAVTPAQESLPATKEEGIALIQKGNPVIQIAQAQVSSALHERDRAASTYWPSLDVVARANIENNLSGVEDVRHDYSLKLEARWVLFDGLLTPANTGAAAARYQEAIQNGRNVTRKTIELMEIAWHQMEVADERAELLRNAMNIAAEVFASRLELREAGKETAINVLDAQSQLYNACINFVNAVFDSEIAAYRVLNTLGELDRGAVANSQPVEQSTVVEQCGFKAGKDEYRVGD